MNDRTRFKHTFSDTGDFVVFIPMVIHKKWRAGKVDFCPICKSLIEDDVDCWLLVNNCRLFPNVIVHHECLQRQDLDFIIRKFKNDYTRAQAFIDENKMWL